jgi:hypothetical protein
MPAGLAVHRGFPKRVRWYTPRSGGSRAAAQLTEARAALLEETAASMRGRAWTVTYYERASLFVPLLPSPRSVNDLDPSAVEVLEREVLRSLRHDRLLGALSLRQTGWLPLGESVDVCALVELVLGATDVALVLVPAARRGSVDLADWYVTVSPSYRYPADGDECSDVWPTAGRRSPLNDDRTSRSGRAISSGRDVAAMEMARPLGARLGSRPEERSLRDTAPVGHPQRPS